MALAIAAPGGRGRGFGVAHPGEDLLHRDARGGRAGDPSRRRRAGSGRADAERHRHHRPAYRGAGSRGGVPPPVATFLLSSATEPEELVAQCRAVAPTVLQIVDAVDPAAYALLRRELPALRLVQVVHVTGEDTIAEALALATQVDALLLDSGSPDAPVRDAGRHRRASTTGRSAGRIVEASPVPVFLAGGLTPANVAEAIAAVRPFGGRPVHRPAHGRAAGRGQARGVHASGRRRLTKLSGPWPRTSSTRSISASVL